MKQCRTKTEGNGDEKSFETVHDEYVHNQANALDSLFEDLRIIKRDNKKENLQILVSDVNEAPSALHLINDAHKVPEKEVDEKLRKNIEMRMYLNPTIRLIKFGMMFNTRTNLIMSLADINKNPSLQAEIM